MTDTGDMMSALPQVPDPGRSSPFPIEVLKLIVSELPFDSLAVCLRVNWTWYWTAGRVLYRRIKLFGEGPEYLEDPPAHQPLLPLSIKDTDHDLSTSVRVVDLHAHSPEWCRDCTTTRQAPNLAVLRIFLGQDKLERAPSGFLHFGGGPAQPCMALEGLRPRKMVFRNASIQGGPVSWSLTSSFTIRTFFFVRRIVVVLTPDLDEAKKQLFLLGRASLWLCHGLENLTFILQPTPWSAHWRAKMSNNKTSGMSDLLNELISIISGSPAPPTYTYTIVNLEAAAGKSEVFGPEVIREFYEEALRREVDKRLTLIVSAEEAVGERQRHLQEAITFMGMREYLDTVDWEGEFEPEEVAYWYQS